MAYQSIRFRRGVLAGGAEVWEVSEHDEPPEDTYLVGTIIGRN